MNNTINIGALHDILTLNGVNTLLVNPETLLPNVAPLNYIIKGLIPENSINFLTGRTGTGKSILAMQLANSLINNEPFLNYQTDFDGFVVYLEFELQAQVYKKRHGSSHFNNKLIRLDGNTFDEKSLLRLDDDVMDLLGQIGENREKIGGTPFLIIDNITYSGIAISKNDEALKFIDKLHSLQKNYGYTILVVGHISKSATKREPIGLEHVLGSTTLLGAFATILGLGKSVKDNETRYLKILKNSNGDDDFSLELRFNKAPGDYHFDFVGETTEAEHLETVEDKNSKNNRYLQVLELIDEGITYTELRNKIIETFSVSEGTAKNWIEKVTENKKVIKQGRLYLRAD